MKKIMVGILSLAMLLSTLSFSVFAQEDAFLLLPNDQVRGVLTGSDSSDLSYVDLEQLTYDYDIEVITDNSYNVFVDLCDANGNVLYHADDTINVDIILQAENLNPGRYYVNVYSNVTGNQSIDYTLNCSAKASNPKVFSGTPLNSSQYTRSSTSYWTFTLDKPSTVNFMFTVPTDKPVSYVIYDENEVYDFDYSTDYVNAKTTLPAGTYYVKAEGRLGSDGMLGISFSAS
jgi:hypothetical protein